MYKDKRMRKSITKIAHIVHPVIIGHASDLVVAQPITFETMRIAQDFAQKDEAADVKLVAVQYHDEERMSLPECFIRVPDLIRSVADIKTFKKSLKLALIKDILDALFDAARDADYMIFTNVDIALQPYFYHTVSKIIDHGYDAFVINRRTISDRYSSIDEIPLMYAQIGESHVGYDCFVFKREFYPLFKLGSVCIGTAWVGRTLLANLVACADKFKEFNNEHLTFHIGDSMPWRRNEFCDYFQENRKEYLNIFHQLEAEHGGFKPTWRSYLLDTLPDRQFPNFE
jgi:hypothetical protein